MDMEGIPPKPEEPSFKPLTFDPGEYRAHLTGCDLTEAQERELLQALWSVMVSFADFGLGINPVQQAVLASLVENFRLQAESGSMVSSEGLPNKPNTITANGAPSLNAESEDS